LGSGVRRWARSSVVAGVLVVGLSGCRWVEKLLIPEQSRTSYEAARSNFKTKLVQRGPSPQPFAKELPPVGVEVIRYRSGSLELKGWQSRIDPAGHAPAVVLLHGGFAFGAEDWDLAVPFVEAGYAVLMPILRGENGMPGDYSLFYDEVEDVLAATAFLARQPGVDRDRIFVTGHSAGGTLALLAALTSDRYLAGSSLSGVTNVGRVLSGLTAPFDASAVEEANMRSAVVFASSFKCPFRIYYGNEEEFFIADSQETARRAAASGKDVVAVEVPGDHFTSINEGLRRTMAFFAAAKRTPR
jgi:dienelactone hydrolase